MTFRSLTTAALFFLAALPAVCAPRVAVFFQPGFPPNNVSAPILPRAIAADLRAAGLQTDLLDVQALADPARLNIHNDVAVILPYGNAYPQAAFANLRAFHQAGGCLVTDGIPFTHATVLAPDGSWNDLGNNSDPALFGADGIGIGGFRSGPTGPVTVAPNDPFGLKPLHLAWGDGSASQAIDPASLPAGDQIIPALTAGGQPTASLIIHHGDGFDGAVDVWTANGLSGGPGMLAFVTEQLLARGTVAALAQKGLLTSAQAQRAFLALDHLPRPHVYTNLVLPTLPRPYPTFQPKMPPPARHLYVADVRHLSHDQQLLLVSLQGLVNRTQPRIYLIFSPDDTFWLHAMQTQGETGTPIMVANPLSLLHRFRSAFHGAVVPDPKVYDSPCIAVDLAGLDNLVIATPSLASSLHLPIKADLRGRFKDDAAALRFARLKLLPRLNPYLALCLDPTLLGSQADDIIAAKGMAFWVTGPKAQSEPGANEMAEIAEVEATFAKMPLNAVVHGFWWHGDGVGLDETPGVTLASRFGKVTTVSDYVANFSVTSGIRLPAMKQKPQPPAPPLNANKVYVALTMSDGDNLVTWRDYFRSYFTDPLHGTFPIGWGMGPTLRDVAPDEVAWYYRHAAPTDEFLCDVSGVGYIYPSEWATDLKNRPAAFRSFYNWTQQYMTEMDMHTLRLMNVQPADIARVAHYLPDVSFLMPDYGYQGEQTYSQFTYTLPTGQPVFRSMMFGSDPQAMANQITSRVGSVRPAFVNAFVWNWGSKLSGLKQMLNDLGPNYVAVTPSQLNTLYRKAEARGLIKQTGKGGK